jgi:hypothetical protein
LHLSVSPTSHPFQLTVFRDYSVQQKCSTDEKLPVGTRFV